MRLTPFPGHLHVQGGKREHGMHELPKQKHCEQVHAGGYQPVEFYHMCEGKGSRDA